MLPSDPMFYGFLFASIALILASGLFSGLTLGMMSQDELGLRVLMESGKEHETRHARKIYPLMQNKHLLLVTLVLCNSAVALSLPLTLDRIVPAWAAIIVSVTGILIFGEVLPQAICSRHGLAIGAFFAPAVRVLQYLTWPISYPFGRVLDRVLGTSDGEYLRREEMATYVGLHAVEREENEEPLINNEVKVITGALSLSRKTVRTIFTPLDKTFCLPRTYILNQANIDAIESQGFSRIPMYDTDPAKLGEYLIVKSLASVHPAASLPLAACASARIRKLPVVPADLGLYDLLAVFQQERAHLAAVRDPEDTAAEGGVHTAIGVVTLEDLVEEMIGAEIVDETDRFVDVVRSIRAVNQFRRAAKYEAGAAATRFIRLDSVEGAEGVILDKLKSTDSGRALRTSVNVDGEEEHDSYVVEQQGARRFVSNV